MTLAIREIGRNVHIFSVNDPTTTLGGLVCTEGITNNNFYVMVRIILEFENDFTLHDEIGSTVARDDQCLKPGNYAILTTGSVNLSTELWLPRTSDATTETQNEPFRTAVRERDGGCVITGQPAENGRFGFWQGFKAVHIFPPSLEQYWSDYNFTAWITPTGSDDPINSVHNGILLDSQMCNLFENYIISINPDDNYKVVCFQKGWSRISGRHLNRSFTENPARPADDLLRWHFRQAVLANMRGVGEPAFESDPPHGWLY